MSFAGELRLAFRLALLLSRLEFQASLLEIISQIFQNSQVPASCPFTFHWQFGTFQVVKHPTAFRNLLEFYFSDLSGLWVRPLAVQV